MHCAPVSCSSLSERCDRATGRRRYREKTARARSQTGWGARKTPLGMIWSLSFVKTLRLKFDQLVLWLSDTRGRRHARHHWGPLEGWVSWKGDAGRHMSLAGQYPSTLRSRHGDVAPMKKMRCQNQSHVHKENSEVFIGLSRRRLCGICQFQDFQEGLDYFSGKGTI